MPARKLAVTGGALVALAACWVVWVGWLSPRTRAFNRSADELLQAAEAIYDLASPEYQHDVLASASESPINGPFFRFDDHLGEARVVTEPDMASLAVDSAVLLGIEFDETDGIALSLDGGGAPIASGLLGARGDTARSTLTAAIPHGAGRDDVGSILLRARSDRTTSITLGWSADPTATRAGENQASIDLIGDGEFHTYEINAANALRRGLEPGDRIRRLFLTPSDRPVEVVEVDFLRFISKIARYSIAPRGVGHETIGGQMRRVAYLLTPQTLDFLVDVPESSPRLTLGAGVLLGGPPVTVSIVVAGEHGEREVSRLSLEGPSIAWEDLEVQLDDWAGESVRVRLAVEGAAGNVAFLSNPAIHSDPRERFNVLVILEDALRADRLSVYGYERATSPVKERLMGEGGVLFRNAVSQATKTRPSVPALMTGLLPSATGVWDWADMLDESYLTLAEVLRSQGFVTASFLQNGNAGPYAGLHQGFSYIGEEWVGGAATEDVLGGRVLEWLESFRDRNFFAYLHVIDPHGVYEPPEPFDEWYDEFDGEGTPIPEADDYEYLDPAWVSEPTEEARSLLYDGEVRHNDEVIGDFLDRLEALGVLESTLVIMTADHGEFLGEDGEWEHHPPGRREVTGIPLMFYDPGRFPEPRVVESVVQLVDVMPTVLELAGVESPYLVGHGRSLVGLLEGSEASSWTDRLAVSEEPTSWTPEDPCVCGSLFFRGGHFIRSGHFSGIPRVQDETRVLRFDRESGTSVSLSPSQNLRAWLGTGRVLRQLQATNAGTRMRFAGRGEAEALLVDPDVVGRLRGLGYIN